MKKAALFATVALGIGTAGQADAIAVYSNDFTTSSTGFSFSSGNGGIATAPSGEKFLQFGGAGGTGSITLTGLAAHASVSISFTLDVVGSMDGTGSIIQGGGIGDFFTVNYTSSGLGTTTPYKQALANYDGGNKQTFPVAGSLPGTGAATINALRYSGFPNSGNGIQDAEYTVSLNPIVDSSGAFTLLFTDGSNEGSANEFYGIDNLVITAADPVVTPVGVPEPLSAALLASGLAGTAITRRRTATRA